MRIASLFLVSLCIVAGGNLFAQSGYNWPIRPFDQQHYISGTFCENRPSGSILRHHFHNGVDIPLSQGGEVYAVADGMVTAIDPQGTNSYVRIGRFAYVHITPNPSLRVGDYVKAYETLIGRTNSQNHVHFIDGYYNQETNPLLPGKLSPFEDQLMPVISYVRFYVNNSTVLFPNNVVSGAVEIVARAMDITDNGPWGRNNGIYKMGYQIFRADGTTPVTPPREYFVFTNKPGNQYIQNVYFTGSDLSTYIYIPSNRITGDHFWDTREVDAGAYIVEVYAEDTRGNRASYRQSVTVAEQDAEPPPPPQFRSVRLVDDDILRISWKPSPATDLKGYRILFSFDGQNFTLFKDEKTVTASDSLYDVANFLVNKPMFFRLQAVDSAPLPNVSDSSAIFGLKVHNHPKRVLLVQAAKPSMSQTALYTGMQDLLAIGDRDYESCSWDELIRLNPSWGRVETVFVFADQDSVTLSTNHKAMITNALQAGVHWVFSGNRLLNAFCQSSQDSLFCRQELGILPEGQLTYLDSIKGTSAGIWDDLNFGFRLGSRLFQADILAPLPSIQPLAASQGQILGGIAALEPGSGRGKVVWLAFPFHWLEPVAARREALSRLFEALAFQTGTTEAPNTEVPDKMQLSAYPNPYQPMNGSGGVSANVSVRLSKEQVVTIDLLDLLGRHLVTVFHGRLAPGEHRLNFARSATTADLATGIYFFVARSERWVAVEKWLVIK